MNIYKQLQHRCRSVIFCGALLLMGGFLWSVAAQAEPVGETLPPTAGGDFFQKCIKLLNYGGELSYTKPGKRDAAVALGLLGDEKAVPILIEHLQNEENNDLRMQVVRALGWIGSAKAVPALEGALHDKYPFVRQQAAFALKGITGKDYQYDRAGLPDPNKLREALRAAAQATDAEANKPPEPPPTAATPPASQKAGQP
jgi:hypothetical protein